jgi:hypothetical protein
MKTFEEQLELVAKLNVIDDVFFHKMMEDIEVAEEVLRLILEKPKLKVIECHTQKFLRNIGAHSVVLDFVCREEDGSIIHVEVQKENQDNYQKRIRFNISNIDTYYTEKGIKYKDMPDVYAVFISRFDIFNEGRTIYHVSRVLDETGSRVDNGIHEMYVNTSVDDGSDIAELMQYFKKSVGEHKKFMKLCNRVKYFKKSQEGVTDMCDVVEEYAEKKAKAREKEAYIQTAENLLRNGASIELIAKSMPSLTYEDVVNLSQQIFGKRSLS